MGEVKDPNQEGSFPDTFKSYRDHWIVIESWGDDFTVIGIYESYKDARDAAFKQYAEHGYLIDVYKLAVPQLNNDDDDWEKDWGIW
jgi:hypothetical protein